MKVVNLLILIFIQYFNYISSQDFNPLVCYPIPTPLSNPLASAVQLEIGCKNLLNMTDLLDLRCCEVEYQKEDNPSTKKHGCMAFLGNYIDNDRYEDIIDWIERGKVPKFEEYTIFLGKTIHDLFNHSDFIENETDYEVLKLDCFTKYIIPKYFIFALLIFGLI